MRPKNKLSTCKCKLDHSAEQNGLLQPSPFVFFSSVCVFSSYNLNFSSVLFLLSYPTVCILTMSYFYFSLSRFHFSRLPFSLLLTDLLSHPPKPATTPFVHILTFSFFSRRLVEGEAKGDDGSGLQNDKCDIL